MININLRKERIERALLLPVSLGEWDRMRLVINLLSTGEWDRMRLVINLKAQGEKEARCAEYYLPTMVGRVHYEQKGVPTMVYLRV